MTKDLYSFGNVFLGLSVISGLIYSALYWLVGPRILTMDAFLWSFPGWTVIQLAGSLFLLKYYRSKGFTLALKTGWMVVILNVVLAVMFFAVLKSHELQAIFVSVVRLSLLCGVVYGAVLIFSAAGKIRLLRWTGIVIVVFTVPMLIGAAWAGDPERSVQLVKMDQWTSFFRNAIPILFMIQFFRERKAAGGESGSLQRRRENLYGLGAFLAFVFTMVAGVSLAREALGSLRWEKEHARQTAHLVSLSVAKTFTSRDDETLTYLLTKPIDYDSTKKYPLVVCLPYGEYSAPMADLLAEDANRRKYPSFIFTPYTRKGTSWGGTPDKFPMVHKDRLLYDALRALKEPGIDPTRVYVSGVSLGGYGSWHMAATHPEMFAAAIPVCGEGDPTRAAGMVDVAVWAFHGAEDENVPVSGSRDMVEALTNAGATPRYTEFDDKAHNIWYEVSRTPGFLDWLFAQRGNLNTTPLPADIEKEPR